MKSVLLRDVQETDLPTLFEQQNLPTANLLAGVPARDRKSFLEHWHNKLLADPTILTQTIVANNAIAGYLLSWKDNGQRMIGYWLGVEYWGRGIATRALTAFLPLIAERPLYAKVAKHNLGSIRVLTKCGFTVFKSGTFVSKPHNHEHAHEIEEWIYEIEAQSQ